jgi:hypothetical protein
VEAKVLPDRRVIHAARGFTCEKICYGCEEFGFRFPNRREIDGYLDSLPRDPTRVTSRIALLDSEGRVLEEFTRPPGVTVLLRAMARAVHESRAEVPAEGE